MKVSNPHSSDLYVVLWHSISLSNFCLAFDQTVVHLSIELRVLVQVSNVWFGLVYSDIIIYNFFCFSSLSLRYFVILFFLGDELQLCLGF
jgi:hypothetical protein